MKVIKVDVNAEDKKEFKFLRTTQEIIIEYKIILIKTHQDKDKYVK
jgi:hypothetical protein